MNLVTHLPTGLGTLVRAMVAAKRTICAIITLIIPTTFLLVVVCRYILHQDLFAYEEWLLPLTFWLYFLGSAVGSFEDSQIRADMLETFFRSSRAAWLRKLFVNIVETLLQSAMVYWAWLMIANDIASYPYWQETVVLKIPYLVPHLAIFTGLVFMLFYGVLHLYVLVTLGPGLINDQRAAKADEEGAE